jgi:hypothetical protein
MGQHCTFVRTLERAAQSADPTVRSVDLDVDVADGIVRVVTEFPLTSQRKANIRTALAAAGSQWMPRAIHWRCDIQAEKLRPYTSHVVSWRGAVAKRRRSTLRPEDLAVFSLEFHELEALVRARKILVDAARTARLTATFAMGGLPLLHWVTLPTGKIVDEVEEALAGAPRFHLLPGLNWSGTQTEQDFFRPWLADVIEADGGHVLLFDTGRDGNGVREAFGLVKEVVHASRPHAGLRVTVLGVLDGRPRFGRLSFVRGRNGVRVRVRLRYRRVPHLPTEDCEVLAGYEVDRAHTRLHRVDGLVFIRVSDAPWLVRQIEYVARRLHLPALTGLRFGRWHRSTFLASTAGAVSTHSLIVERRKREQLRERLRMRPGEGGELDSASILLLNAERTELAALQTAIDWGLFPGRAHTSMVANIRTRFEQARERLLTLEWDRSSKRLVVV